MFKKELKLNIKNFQSIKKAELTFQEGVNLIVGGSNSGKTGCTRAIKALLSNTTGSQRYITYGEETSDVTMEYLNNTVNWTRNKKEVAYEVNGERYVKIGSSDLFTLLQTNGFVIDDKENVMNIEGEWDCLFPFDKTGSELFKLFENIFCVADSAKIMQAYKQIELDSNKSLQELTNNYNRNNVKVKALQEYLDKVDPSTLSYYKELITNLYSKHSKLSTSNKELDRIYSYIKAVPKNIKVKTFIYDDIVNYQNIKKDMKVIENIMSYIEVTKGIDKTIKTFNTNALNSYINIKKDLNILNNISKYNNCIRGTSKSNKTYSTTLVDKYAGMRNDVKVLDNLSRYENISNNIDKTIKTIDNSLLTEYTSIKDAIRKLRSISDEVKELRQQEIDTEEKIVQLKVKLESYDTCPTCGQVLCEN